MMLYPPAAILLAFRAGRCHRPPTAASDVDGLRRAGCLEGVGPKHGGVTMPLPMFDVLSSRLTTIEGPASCPSLSRAC